MKPTRFSILLSVLMAGVMMLPVNSCKKDKEQDQGPGPVYTNGEGEIGSAGGTVRVENPGSTINGAYVIIPANALTQSTLIQIYEIPNDVSFFGDSRIIVVGFKPSGLMFNGDVEIGIPYPSEINSQKLGAFFYDETDSEVYLVDIKSVNTNKNLVVFNSNHFSGYFAGWDGLPCPGIPTMEYEGQTYNTVYIGGQCWFKENLNVGTIIPGQQSPSANGIIEKYCYEDNPANCETYGG